VTSLLRPSSIRIAVCWHASCSAQIELHRIYGGVVPELASRDHVQRLLPLVSRALAVAEATPDRIQGIAYTAGPGLIGALLLWRDARSLARLCMAGAGPRRAPPRRALLAPLLESQPPPFPHLALLVSGGHTMLIEVRRIGEYTVLGETRDDAAGEAFDKSAKLLGLPYPGGPQLAALAERRPRGCLTTFRDRCSIDRDSSSVFPDSRPRCCMRCAPSRRNHPRNNCSGHAPTSRVKCKRRSSIRWWRKRCARSNQTGLVDLVVAGGVGANRRLRARFDAESARRGLRVYYPRLEFCTDNAAMIAVAGLRALASG
jgi:N6-L-threonylcarbamoyladenine synthase